MFSNARIYDSLQVHSRTPTYVNHMNGGCFNKGQII